jgi:hypothetical protein
VNFWFFIFLGYFSLLMLLFYYVYRRRSGPDLRDIPAFYQLQGAIEGAVEDGTCVHVAIGRSEITSPQAAAAMVGLSMLRRVCQVASDSDRPPIATAGCGSLTILAQDTLRGTYRSLGMISSYNNNLGRLVGLTPYSYAAGLMSFIADEGISANLLIGNFGAEAALITGAGERSQVLTLAGSHNLAGQAVMYAGAHEPLIGEELYAGGAYVGTNLMHIASLHTQDVARWMLVGVMIIAAIWGIISELFL